MLKFISFGSGSSGNCYVLISEKTTIMIDSGLGIRQMKKHFSDYGMSLEKVDFLLVTHDHADHVKSVGCISQEFGVPVLAVEAVHKGIESNYCVRKKVPQKNIRTITKGETMTLGDMLVTSFAVPHDSLDNVGYRIEHEGTVFCLITDVGHVTEDIRQEVSRANYLVIEANHDVEMLLNGNYPKHLKERIHGDFGHLSNDDCARLLIENATEKFRHVWLCHLSQDNNHPELARKTIEYALGQNGIVAGKDFLLTVLKRRTPSEMFVLE